MQLTEPGADSASQRLYACTVREFDTADGRMARAWTRIGVARSVALHEFAHYLDAEGLGLAEGKRPVAAWKCSSGWFRSPWPYAVIEADFALRAARRSGRHRSTARSGSDPS
jgi:predicted DNA-binding WGR domain protein